MDRIESIYKSALAEHPEFNKIGKEKIERIISKELERIDSFEAAARKDISDGFSIDPELAATIGTIWVFSGPGTYREPLKADDKFKDYAWARWMDRDRLNCGFALARKIAEAKSGQPASPKIIAQYGPYIVYNGTSEENNVLRDVFEKGEIDIPAEKIKVLDKTSESREQYTANQVQTFKLPNDPSLRGKEIVLVSHAPHLNRILHMINRFHSLPNESIPYLFPLPTPESGRKQFTELEIKGLLYYMLLSEKASEEPYPYKLFPAK
jgi:hypothetical protein